MFIADSLSKICYTLNNINLSWKIVCTLHMYVYVSVCKYSQVAKFSDEGLQIVT